MASVFIFYSSCTLLLQVFSVFSVGYLARPIGGIIFGYLGDKYGRSKALRFSLYLMGFSTFLMGILPTYQQIGVIATVLLVFLRIFQGISAGGELVGSTVYIFENSEKKNQTFCCSFVTFSCTVGVLLGSLVAALT
jgi:MFS transporter, MHS family, proline/betaine transporter